MACHVPVSDNHSDSWNRRIARALGALLIAAVGCLALFIGNADVAAQSCEPCAKLCAPVDMADTCVDMAPPPSEPPTTPPAVPLPRIRVLLLLDKSFSMLAGKIGKEPEDPDCVNYNYDQYVYEKTYPANKKDPENPKIQRCEQERKTHWVKYAKLISKSAIEIAKQEGIAIEIMTMFNHRKGVERVEDLLAKTTRADLYCEDGKGNSLGDPKRPLRPVYASPAAKQAKDDMALLEKWLDASQAEFRCGDKSEIKDAVSKIAASSLSKDGPKTLDVFVIFSDGQDTSHDALMRKIQKTIEIFTDSVAKKTALSVKDEAIRQDIMNQYGKLHTSLAGNFVVLVTPNTQSKTSQSFAQVRVSLQSDDVSLTSFQSELRGAISSRKGVQKIQQALQQPTASPVCVRPAPGAAATCQPLANGEDGFSDVVVVGREADWHCSGVAVSPSWVLTARHCLPASRVRAGQDIREDGLTRRVVDVQVPAESGLDAALLRLDSPLPAVVHLRRRADEASAPNGIVRLVGFGAIDPRGSYGFGRRHHTDLPLSGWGCDGGRAGLWGCQPRHEFTVPASGGRDTCDGDSGGPVFELIPVARPCCPWRLLGVTSRPLATSSSRCGGGGIYVRADGIAAWIDSTIQTTEHASR
jgi:hypothetical protein